MRKTFLLSLAMSSLFYAQENDSIQMKSDSLIVDSSFINSDKIKSIEDVQIIGKMKSVRKSQSPIPVDIYAAPYFQKNPTPNIFESLSMINGIKPQLNCSVCNTGDIHINGLEGAYTTIIIDGMPMVSSLSTVYGLSGIPNSLVERIEVVKGPASSLYGSEAMGGVINIITKNAFQAPKIGVDVMTSTWLENNLDVSTKLNVGNKVSSLLSINYFNFNQKIDQNKDNFTDAALQDRISIFNKWNFKRIENRLASFAVRYLYEDRSGGELQWNSSYRGSNKVYGESIYTQRWEAFGLYQWPIKEKIFTQFSYVHHEQDSFYGNTSFDALQKVFFLQNYWEKEMGKHQLLLGATFKNTLYDDNTPATKSFENAENKVSKTPIVGLFIQDEFKINPKHTFLLGYRFDYNKTHQEIHSPRFAYKFSPNPYHDFRLNFGTGFRVVNLFTEDHAALTGSREVVIVNELKPEKSINFNFNYVGKLPINDRLMTIDFSAFYTHFNNKIVGDFDTDPQKIIYDNLSGYGISRGLSLNIEYQFNFPLAFNLGATYLDVFQKTDNSSFKNWQLHSPKWSSTYSLTYKLSPTLIIDWSGQIYGPMRLPVFENDFRPEFSPWFHIANIKVAKTFNNGFEIYGGVKNIFNFLPKNPIMRPFDPFDNTVDDAVNNPNYYTFDTTYGYASMQGARGYLGIKYTFK